MYKKNKDKKKKKTNQNLNDILQPKTIKVLVVISKRQQKANEIKTGISLIKAIIQIKCIISTTVTTCKIIKNKQIFNRNIIFTITTFKKQHRLDESKFRKVSIHESRQKPL